ncbi:MAG: hypothetical protein H6R18_1216 [Proteobacteria bacterium]|nr:hypothetical protein [Pseudomonadota bacterium]
MRLFTRLFLFINLPILVGATLLLLFIGSSLEKELREDLAKRAYATTESQVESINTLFSTYRQSLVAMSKEKTVVAGKPAGMRHDLSEWQRHLPDVDMIFFADLDGHALAADGTVFDLDISPHREKLSQGKSAVSSPLICRFTNRPAVLLLQPVISAEGKVIGALAASINTLRIQQSFATMRKAGGAYAILADDQRKVVVGAAGESISPNQTPDEKNAPITAKLAKIIKPGKQTQFAVHVHSDDDTWQIFHAGVELTGWHLILAYPESETYASVHKIRRTGFWILIFLGLASLSALAIFNRTLLLPIAKLAEGQKKLEQGDLSARINSKRKDELGQLSRSFDHMAERLGNALKAEESAERIVRSLFEGSEDAICMLDGNRYIDVNPYTEKLFHGSRQQLLATGPLELSPEFQPDGRPSKAAGQEYIDRSLKGEPQHIVWRHSTFDGNVFDCEVHLSRFEMDGKYYVQAIVRDITQILKTEVTAHAMEERFKRVFEASPDSMVIVRLNDGTIIEANHGFETISGYKREEAIGKTMYELNIWADPEARKPLVERMIAEGVVQNFPFVLHTKGGHLLDVTASTGTFIIDDVSYYIAITRDISAEKNIQRELAASEARLKTIFEAAPIPIALIRLADFTYISVNHAHEEMFGAKSEEIEGKSVKNAGYVYLDDGKVRKHTKRLLATGKIDNEEAEARDKRGQKIYFVYSSRIIELNGEKVILSINTDISRLKMVEEGLRRTEEALRESEQRFFALFQSSPAALAVFHCGKHGFSVLQLNQVWFSTFLFPENDVIGKSTEDFGLWQDEADRTRFNALVEQQEEVRGFEAWMKRYDGKEVLCSISGRTVSVGKHRLLLVAYADITQQREFEAALHDFNVTLELRIEERTRELQQAQASLMHSEKLAALGALVAGVAHELSTPIGNSLVVSTTLTEQTAAMHKMFETGLKRSALENYLKDSVSGLAILERNLERATELIHNFKSVAVDQTSTQRRQFSLKQIVDEILTTMQPALKKRPFALQTEIDPSLTLNSFPGPLEQIIINLVNNALLHGFENREQGTVLIRAEALGKDQLRLIVRDDGCGVPANDLRRIFDPFFTTKLGKGGSGLGLHIVRNIVEDLLGGHIKAESKLGEGLLIVIDIPREAPDLKPEEQD